MALFLYDVFITLNFIAFWVTVADKAMEGDLELFFWISIAFGGCGAALACFLVRHHTRSGLAWVALVVGAIQLFVANRITGGMII